MSGATISLCGLYRYTLTRDTGGGSGIVNFIMLNPSTADASVDDPTIRRCIGFARAWGYRTLVVTNLFALRATDPAALKTAVEAVGPENDGHLLEQARVADLVVCAWGATGKLYGRGDRVTLILAVEARKTLHCLRKTAAGHPGHPLYLPASLTPQRWP
jgi:hypothetical protein